MRTNSNQQSVHVFCTQENRPLSQTDNSAILIWAKQCERDNH